MNTPGGVSPVRELVWDGAAVSVNGARRIFPLVPPDAFGAASFDAGALPEIFAAHAVHEVSEVRDALSYASGAGLSCTSGACCRVKAPRLVS